LKARQRHGIMPNLGAGVARQDGWAVDDLIELLILDVDGVLTDGRLVLTESGDLIKAFHVLDGGGIRLWCEAGRQVALVTARTSPAVDRRAAELGIELVEQGRDEKLIGYESVRRQAGVADEAVCYLGDDFLDLPPMRRCGYPAAVANAAPEVKRAAAYVTECPGGSGAVREIVRHLLVRDGQWRDVLAAHRAG